MFCGAENAKSGEAIMSMTKEWKLINGAVIKNVLIDGDPLISIERQILIEQIIIKLPNGEMYQLQAECVPGFVPFIDIKPYFM